MAGQTRRGTKIGPVFGTGAADAFVSGVARVAKDCAWHLRSSNDWECNRALAHVRVWTFFKPVLLSASVPFKSLRQEDPGTRGRDICIRVSSILGRDLNWNGKARLYTIHYDHRLEALNVRVLIEESPGELLIIVHGARGNV